MSLENEVWWNKETAAAELSVSTKTIERKARGIESRKVPIAGRRPERQWRADHLRAAIGGALSPEVIAPGADALPRGRPVNSNGAAANAIAPGAAEGALVRAQNMNARHDVAAALLTLTESARRSNAPLWLRLDAAAEYSGLSVALIRRLCRAGKLVSVRDRSIKVNRAALDKYGAGEGEL